MTLTTYQNREVEILGTPDSDPTCSVWIRFIDQPELQMFVDPSELTTETFFCAYTTKPITGEYCEECSRLDCAITAEDLADILS